MSAIVVPLDGSEFAERALGFATTLANATQGTLTLVQVVPRPWRIEIPGDLTILQEQLARRYLRDLATRLDRAHVETQVLHGDPANALLDFAREHHDALFVLSTHGRGGLDRAVFGSVADKVLRGATTPLVIVPTAASSMADAVTDLIVPLDGSPLSEAALPQAVAYARALGATLRLVRVVEPIWESLFMYGSPFGMYVSDTQLAGIQREADAEATSYLAALATSVGAEPPRVTHTIRHGHPANELLRMSADYPHGLLVMATHGRGGLRRWALGSVTTEVAQRASIPLLVIPSATQPDVSTGGATR
jgi:nucleotide-binding universal stress UspA family protein